MTGLSFVDNLWQDVRYGARMLVKSPGYTIVAVLALALGIGANSAMFSYVNAWVLHPLPYPHGDRLVLMLSENTRSGSTSRVVDAADFYDVQRSSRDFDEFCTLTTNTFNLTGDGRPERVNGYRVSWNFFQVLGASPAMGRVFLPPDDQAGSAKVAILSRGLWETRYGADPQIVGRAIKLDGESYTVVGVMPSKFQLPLTGEANVWIPLALSAEQRTQRGKEYVFAIGRLASGITMAQAQGEVSSIAARLEKEYPDANANSSFLLHTLEAEIGDNQGNQELLICFWIVALVLLMACANVANLMLARATGRAKELAVRTALGAGRLRLVRQLVTETVLLFVAASCAGVWVAHWTVIWLGNAIPARARGYLMNYGQVSLDYQTLLYTLGIAFVTGVAFGLAPAISGSKLDVFKMLKEASGRASGDVHGRRLRSTFVVSEIALAVVVVVCSALLATKFLGLVSQNPGFQPENVMAAHLDLPKTKYASPAGIRNFYDQVVERLRSTPQIEAAGASQYVPFGECCSSVPVYALDKPAPAAGDVPYAIMSAVTPEYFSTLRIELLKGRFFTPADGPSTASVIVINQTVGRYFWPNGDPVGQKLRFTAGGADHVATVVGVVQDVKLYNSTSAKHDRELYVPFEQLPASSMGIAVRSSADRSATASAIQSAIWAVDADQPVSLVRPIRTLMDDQYAGFQIVTDLLAYFSALALLLGAIGIYAVMAFNVGQRTHEVGIRMALGADPRDVLRMVLGSAARLVGVGLGIGVGGALVGTRVLNSFLVDFSGDSAAHGAFSARLLSDPAAFACGVLLLVIVAFVACYIPARRAMRVDPIVALRYE